MAAIIQFKRFGALSVKVHPVSAWVREMDVQSGEPEGTRTQVQVEMLTGDIFVGNVAGFSPDLELADREITLSQSMWVKRRVEHGDEGKLIKVPSRYERLILRGDQINFIGVRKWIPKDNSNSGGS